MKIKLTVIFTILIDILWFWVIIPALPNLVDYYHTNNFMLAIWVAIFAIWSFFSSQIFWSLSDKFWRKKILIISIIWNIIWGFIIIMSKSIYWFLLARAISGITAWNIVAAQSILTDIAKDHKERIVNLWLFGAIFWVWFIIWPAVGWFALNVWIKFPFIISLFLTILNLISVIFLLPETNKNLTKDKKISFNVIWNFIKIFEYKDTKHYYIIWFLVCLGLTCYQTSFTLYLKEFFGTSWEVSWFILSMIWLIMMLNQVWLMKQFRLKYFSNKKIILISFIGLVSIFLLMFFIPRYLFIIIAIWISTIFQWTFRPVFQNEIIWRSQKDIWEINGSITSLMNLASIFGPLIWWALIDIKFSPFWPAWIIIMIWLFMYINQHKKSKLL